MVLLRERIYGAISCLAALTLVTRQPAEHDAWERLIGMLVVAGGLFAASLLAEVVAQLAVNNRRLRGAAGRAMLKSSGQILMAAFLPAIPLLVAAFGWFDVDAATWVAVGLLVAQLGLFVLIAVRRLALRWWQQGVAMASFMAVGAVVIAMKVVAH